MKPTKKEVGNVPIHYIQNVLNLHQVVASGDINGVEYTVHLGITNGQFYVQFKGMKGSIPRMAVTAEDLVHHAYDIVLKNKLIK